MSGKTRYSPELRERATRMFQEPREDYPSEWPMIFVLHGTKEINSGEHHHYLQLVRFLAAGNFIDSAANT